MVIALTCVVPDWSSMLRCHGSGTFVEEEGIEQHLQHHVDADQVQAPLPSGFSWLQV